MFVRLLTLVAFIVFNSQQVAAQFSGSLGASGFGGAVASSSPPPTPSETAWTPAMVSPPFWSSATDQTSYRDTGGSIAVSGTAVETWNDISGNARHAVSAAASGGASSAATRGVVGPVGSELTVSGQPVYPLRIGASNQTNRYLTPASTYSMASGNIGNVLFVFARIRPPASALGRTLLGTSNGSSQYHIGISDTGAQGRVTVGSVAGILQTDTSTRLEMFEQFKIAAAGSGYYGNFNGNEGQANSVAGGGASIANARLSIGNLYGSAGGVDADLFEVLVLPTGLGRGNMQRLEGWVAHTYGQTALLPATHPYKTVAPTVPTGTTSTVDWIDTLPNVANATWLGNSVGMHWDSFNSNGLAPPIDAVTDLWAFAYTSTQSELDRAKSVFFPGGQRGIKYIRVGAGVHHRSYSHFDAVSGLGDRIAYNNGGRLSGAGPNGRNNDDAHKYLLSNISDVTSLADKNTGGGVLVEMQALPAHFQTTKEYPRGRFSFKTYRAVCTLTSGTPGKVNITAHSLVDGDPVVFNGGTLPAAVAQDVNGGTYYVKSAGVNDFEVASTPGGASINFATSSTGTVNCDGGPLNGTYKAIGAPQAAVYAARVVALADMVMDYMEYVHQSIAPVKIFSPQVETTNPQRSAYGTSHPWDNTVYVDFLKEIIPRMRGSAILNSLSTYGGGASDNRIHIHIDSWEGALGATTAAVKADATVLSTGLTAWQEIESLTIHDLTLVSGRNVGAGNNLGDYANLASAPDVSASGADLVRTSWTSASALAAAEGRGIWTDENESFNVVIPRPWRFVNYAMTLLNTTVFGNAPSFVGPLHLWKVATDDSLEGYAWTEFNQVAGTWTYQYWNYGSMLPFISEPLWGASITGMAIPAATINYRAGAFKTTAGKLVVYEVNRLNSTYTPGISIGLGGERTMRGTEYTLSGASYDALTQTDLGLVTASSVTIAPSAWSIRKWVEQ